MLFVFPSILHLCSQIEVVQIHHGNDMENKIRLARFILFNEKNNW